MGFQTVITLSVLHAVSMNAIRSLHIVGSVLLLGGGVLLLISGEIVPALIALTLVAAVTGSFTKWRNRDQKGANS